MGFQRKSTMTGYRDAVTELIGSGEPFGDVEAAIDRLDDVTVDEKAALWLLAFSLRDPAADELDERTSAHLELVSGAAT